jgi:hypothetical protein
VHLSPGASLDGWILKVRPDGKVDISLRQPAVRKRIAEGAETVLSALLKAGNALAIGDKSSPDEISDVLGMSKKNFKDAIGLLYRRRLVQAEEARVVLAPEADWTEEGRALVSSVTAGDAPLKRKAPAKGGAEDDAGSGGAGWGNFSPRTSPEWD